MTCIPKFSPFILALLFTCNLVAQQKDYYELRIYHGSSDEQISRIDNYLQHAFLPLIHKNGIDQVGVFKPIGQDTASQKKIFVLFPSRSLEHLAKISDEMVSEMEQKGNGGAYLNTAHDQPAYDRIEINWLRAFSHHPKLNVPKLAGQLDDHVFELRSYEAASETLYRKKVDMFNAGGEIDLFESLGFNALFYAETLAGKNTPNLWYMTSHENMESREKNWDAFRNDPRWDKMKNIPKYQNTVSHIDLYLLKATGYSDIK